MEFFESIKSELDQLPSYEVIHLVQVVQSLQVTIEKISDFVTEPKNLEYGRNVIYRSEHVEVIVLMLPSMARTLIHDYGTSQGCILAVEGSLINFLYTFESADAEPVYKGLEEISEGDFFTIEGDTFHMMYNPTASPVVTFHVYTPPLGGGIVSPL
ncbi:cysteine dioxygenase family protein [Fictibacillus sp. B-59209]|uniref:cysteine dioxygenase n=1 Tax=Fictibacillus sp. B-59209 TaxID=3024873 RepID=UPI002E1BEE46|nr:cysteine dioxygenase family protein [Fictibacillus sp. B-59209]